MTPEPAADERQVRVFVSYPRVEQPFVRRLTQLLDEHGTTVWVDWADIRPTEEWLKAILRAIESAVVFVFVITPESCASQMCQLEINHAVEHAKKVVPMLRRPVDSPKVPDAVKALQWIDCADGVAETAMPALVAALETDLEWVRSHTLYLERALEWDRGGRTWSDMLRGRRLAAAERWMGRADSKTRVPAPIHGTYIQRSRVTQRRFRTGLASVFAGAGLVALWFGWQAWTSSADVRHKEQAEIVAQIKLDEVSRPSPLNLSRRLYLDTLRRRAEAAAFDEGSAKLARLIAQVPPEAARVQVLDPSSEREGVIVPARGEHFFAWSRDRIDVFGPSGIPLENHRPARGRIVWVASDPVSTGLLYEVEYEDFADSATASRVRVIGSGRRVLPNTASQDDDHVLKESDVIGSERELFLLEVPPIKTRSLGLTRKLEAIALPGDAQASFVSGYLYRESSKDLPDREQLALRRRWDEAKALASVRQGSVGQIRVNVDPLSYDVDNGAVAFEVRDAGIKRTYAGTAEWESIWVSVLHADARVERVTEPFHYATEAPFFQRAVPDLKRIVDLTDVRPKHKPSALRVRDTVTAILGGQLTELKADGTVRSMKMAWTPEDVTSARFTTDGSSAIAVFTSRAIGQYSTTTGQLSRLFPAPDANIRASLASADGRFVFLWDGTGAVIRWDIAAFGADGWAAPRSLQSR